MRRKRITLNKRKSDRDNASYINSFINADNTNCIKENKNNNGCPDSKRYYKKLNEALNIQQLNQSIDKHQNEESNKNNPFILY